MDIKAKLNLFSPQKDSAKIHNFCSDNEIEAIVDGISKENVLGSFFCTNLQYPASFEHGEQRLLDCSDVSADNLVLLSKDEALSDWNWDKAVFLDTETTGLSGGTGTYAFLVGIGYFENDSFVIKQFFMRDLFEEGAMLAEILEIISEKRFLVTFNGKSYDWPLLKTRFILQGLGKRFPIGAHCDLLHIARRIWGKQLASCSLKSLEENILGLTRHDDIHGAEIPETYFEYLNTRDARPLETIFTHNRQDVLSMVSLLLRLACSLSSSKGNSWEKLAFAKLFEQQHNYERAIMNYQGIMQAPQTRVCGEAARRLSLLYKKQRDYKSAITIWEQLAENQKLGVFAHVELAKYYEHKEKDFDRAMKYVEEALSICREMQSLSHIETARKKYRDLEYRLNRLLRKETTKERREST